MNMNKTHDKIHRMEYMNKIIKHKKDKIKKIKR